MRSGSCKNNDEAPYEYILKKKISDLGYLYFINDKVKNAHAEEINNRLKKKMMVEKEDP
ncbi:MAG: hypothetical protein ACOCRK_03570 [bacterium]